MVRKEKVFQTLIHFFIIVISIMAGTLSLVDFIEYHNIKTLGLSFVSLAAFSVNTVIVINSSIELYILKIRSIIE